MGPMKNALAISFIFLAWALIFASDRYNVPIENSPQKGPKNAPITIIEFLDFQ